MNKTLTKRNGTRIAEKDVEKKGKERLKEIGYVSEKFRSPNNKGVPDQLVTGRSSSACPIPLTFFVEYKKPLEEPTLLQKIDHRARRSRGYYVLVVDSYESVDIMIEFVTALEVQGQCLPHPEELL